MPEDERNRDRPRRGRDGDTGGEAAAGPDHTENVKILSTEDEKIKSFGEMLTNNSSRSLFQILMKDERTALRLSQETGLSLPLVLYHLNKMLDLDVIKISRIETNVKGQDMKYYRATKFAIVVMPSSMSERARESRSLMRSLRAVCRFAGIGIAGVASWFGTRFLQGPGASPISADFQLEDRAARSGAPAEPAEAGEGAPAEAVETSDDAPAEPAGDTAAMMEESSEDAPAGTEGADQGIAEEALRTSGGQPDAISITQDPALVPVTGDGLLLPVVVAIAVVGAGLFLEMLYRTRMSRRNAGRAVPP